MIFWYILLGVVILLLYLAIGVCFDELVFDNEIDNYMLIWPVAVVILSLMYFCDWIRDMIENFKERIGK